MTGPVAAALAYMMGSHLEPVAALLSKKTGKPVKPAALGETPLELASEKDPREALADWMSSPSNKFFAPALASADPPRIVKSSPLTTTGRPSGPSSGIPPSSRLAHRSSPSSWAAAAIAADPAARAPASWSRPTA